MNLTEASSTSCVLQSVHCSHLWTFQTKSLEWQPCPLGGSSWELILRALWSSQTCSPWCSQTFKGLGIKYEVHEDLGRENMLKSVPLRAPGSHQKGDESFLILKEGPSLKNTTKLLEACSQLPSSYTVSSEWFQKQDHKLLGGSKSSLLLNSAFVPIGNGSQKEQSFHWVGFSLL